MFYHLSNALSVFALFQIESQFFPHSCLDGELSTYAYLEVLIMGMCHHTQLY
jgi:hypothetical protein